MHFKYVSRALFIAILITTLSLFASPKLKSNAVQSAVPVITPTWNGGVISEPVSKTNIIVEDIHNDGGLVLLLGSENLVQVNRLSSVAGENVVYLPQVHGVEDACHIYGIVTEKGIPAVEVTIFLRLHNGLFWQNIDTATTNQDGKYCFDYLDTLVEGQKYSVQFLNYGYWPADSRLIIWNTRALTSYERGSVVNIGNFDIANVYLYNPGAVAHITLPETFIWRARPESADDIYEVALYDSDTSEVYNVLMPEPGKSAYLLTDLPPGFNLFDWCDWQVRVHGPDGGVGYSYDTYQFTITGYYP